jgi:hypothetical protein
MLSETDKERTPMTLLIWGTAAVGYGLFWCWYVGFRSKVTHDEVNEIASLLETRGRGTEAQTQHILEFLRHDDGKDFIMVNLIHIAQPLQESQEKLERYQKIFLGKLARKAGHPIMMGRAASGNIENHHCEHADNWHAAGMVRYRSRRDFMEMLRDTAGSEHHALKLEALEKTFAFPASPWFIFGGPRVVVALVMALVAALVQLSQY